MIESYELNNKMDHRGKWKISGGMEEGWEWSKKDIPG